MEINEFEDTINYLTEKIGERFRTFGGGKNNLWNPISQALKDTPIVFAMGVDVKQVVTFIFEEVIKESKA